MTTGLPGPYLADTFRIADLHVSRSQEKNAPVVTRAFEGAQERSWQNPQLAYAPLGRGSCVRRTGHPFAASGLVGLHR